MIISAVDGYMECLNPFGCSGWRRRRGITRRFLISAEDRIRAGHHVGPAREIPLEWAAVYFGRDEPIINYDTRTRKTRKCQPVGRLRRDCHSRS